MVYFSVKHSFPYTIIKDIRRVSNLEVGQARAPPQAHSNLIPRLPSLVLFSKEEEKGPGDEVEYIDVGGHFEVSKEISAAFSGKFNGFK